ncbi:MAG: Gfo/Idh/MocA family oxidoreductase [Candidatus Omnitrophica bacterium]|nr:Gfo/Idh/MocA family oxidoreductase [Candidatus Omnitrophota bacterium]
MKKINIGVIGVGHLGQRHAHVLSKIKKVQLVGICDIDKNKGKELARTIKTTYYADYSDLLKQVQAVIVSVPTKHHFRVGYDSLKQGAHALIEKPITPTVAEAGKLINLAKKKKLILAVGHIERFNNAFRTVCDIVKKPKFIECHRLSPFPARSLDIGVVSDLMIHDIDLILELVKSDVVSIDAVGVNVLTNLEDIANVRLRFKNGCVANLTASRISAKAMRKFRIFLKDSYISLDYMHNQASVYKKENKNIYKHEVPIDKADPLQNELESFLDCILYGKDPVVSGWEGKEALSLAIKIQKKINEYIKHYT